MFRATPPGERCPSPSGGAPLERGPGSGGRGTFHGHGGAVNGTGSIAMVSPDGRDGVVIAQNLLGEQDADLPGLAREMVCTALGR